MTANKYERFQAMEVDRSEIHGADYNPRKISLSAQKKLKKFLKSKAGGLLTPLTWNSKTGNIVSGHQRLEILDQLHKGKPYRLTVAKVEMNEADEVKANVFMNNPSAQGEWDIAVLAQIGDIIPDLNFVDDLGFDQEELDVMGIGVEDVDTQDDLEGSGPTQDEIDTFREVKKNGREQAKRENEDGDGTSYSSGDFTLTFIFPDAESKRGFLENIGMNKRESRLNSQVLQNLFKK